MVDKVRAARRQPEDAFNYTCLRCKRCCSNKRIQVNPYEVARLARHRGETTTEVRARWTVGGAGTFLRQTEDGACVFLGPGGCTVHPARPLVCRLYPLGRHATDRGEVWFSDDDLTPPPGGDFSGDGTVSGYLASQGAGPFIEAADDYFNWYLAVMKRLGAATAVAKDRGARAGIDMLDMDAAVAEHCRSAGLPEPQDIEDRKRLHLTVLYGPCSGRRSNSVAKKAASLKGSRRSRRVQTLFSALIPPGWSVVACPTPAS
jgi:Fe-S-cluster containining protein